MRNLPDYATTNPVRRAVGALPFAILVGLLALTSGCDKDDDEESDEPIEVDEKPAAQTPADAGKPAEPAVSTPDPVDPATPTPTGTVPTTKKDAGAPQDAGAQKDAGGSKPGGSQACMQKCSAVLAQCMVSAGKDGGLFAPPDMAKCQAAADACRKACGAP